MYKKRQVKGELKIRYCTFNSFLCPAYINESWKHFIKNSIQRFQASFVMKHPCVSRGSHLHIDKQASLG